MNTAMTREELERILDKALQDVTERTAGVRLHQGEQPLGEDLCTVHITFDKGFSTSLTLCADTSLLARMAGNSFHEETVTAEDLEEFSKEYLNVLCGKVAGAMFQATQVSAHFGTPTFYHGRYEPEGQEAQFVLTYADEHSKGAHLIHHVACPPGGQRRREGGFGMSKRVMVVDDSRLVRVQLEDVLKGTDYEVAAYCRSGEEAIEQYGAVKPDLVTMDIIMKGMDGLDAAEIILKSNPDARIVMVSSLAYDDTFERAKAIGAKGFVDKPFHQEQLLKVFEQALS